MAPRKRTTSTPATGSRPKAKAKVGPVPEVDAGAKSVNASVQAQLAACDAEIRNHFPGIAEQGPTADSGVPVYHPAKAAEALGKGLPYICSCPLYWLNVAYELQPNVPKYESRLENLQHHFFDSPNRLDKPIMVFLEEGHLFVALHLDDQLDDFVIVRFQHAS